MFTINTKNHPRATIWVRHDTVKVSGHNVPYVRNSRYEARRVGQILGHRLGWTPPVTGVVVVLADRLTVKDQPEDAHVVGGSAIPRWFRTRTRLLEPGHIEAIYDVARQSTTWV